MKKFWNLEQLSFPMSVPEYLVQHEGKNLYLAFSRNPICIQKFPKLRIAECPICGSETAIMLDLLSLKNWNTDRMHRTSLFGLQRNSKFQTENETYRTCSHYFATDVFIQFHGQSPKKTREELPVPRYFGPEKPYLLGEVVERFSSVVTVMHSLPICRIEIEKFIPSYTAFLVTYFLDEREYPSVHSFISDVYSDPVFSPIYKPHQSGNDRNGKPYQLWWDMEYYIKEQKLLWLEPDTKTLPLVRYPGHAFPFTGLSGRDYPVELKLP